MGFECDTYFVGLMNANQMCVWDVFLSQMRLRWSALEWGATANVHQLAKVTHPVEGVMMQPPRSAVTLQPQPLSGVSWFIPKLCPSSWARVTAAPRGLSEWSCHKWTRMRSLRQACLSLRCYQDFSITRWKTTKIKSYIKCYRQIEIEVRKKETGALPCCCSKVETEKTDCGLSPSFCSAH